MLSVYFPNLQQLYGVDGFKLDAGDPYFYDHPNLLSFKNISPNDQYEEWTKIGFQFPLNEYRAMWKMGGQPLVQHLADKSHSWDDLRKLMPNTLVQQLMGYTFTCPDMIGGGAFTSSLPRKIINQKLIVRSAQIHALTPMMQFSVAPMVTNMDTPDIILPEGNWTYKNKKWKGGKKYSINVALNEIPVFIRME